MSRHGLLGAVYGTLGSGEATSFITRMIQPDGSLFEHDSALSNGAFRRVLDGTGATAKSWAALTPRERWEVRGKRVLVALYVMSAPRTD